MGTLFNQRPRQETLSSYFHEIEKALELMNVHGPLTPAQWHAACDIVRTALAIQSADALDEQLGGLGAIVQELVEKLGHKKA